MKTFCQSSCYLIGMAVAAESKNPQIGQSTTTILKSLCGGMVLNLTDLHGNGLRLKVMWPLIQINLHNKRKRCEKDNEVNKKCSKHKTVCLKSDFQKNPVN